MSMFRYGILCLGIISALFSGGCSTDIEVIAPKRDVTIIYGILEANKTRHFIRINKSFVGKDSASTLAKQKGVNEYTDSEMRAEIIELRIDGDDTVQTGAIWPLRDTIITTKTAGAFNNEANKVYYFNALLNADYLYRIKCVVNVDGEDRKVVTAVTDLVGNLSTTGGGIEEVRLNKPKISAVNSSNGGVDRNKQEVRFVNSNDYASSYEVQWTSVAGGVQYTSYFRLYYRDFNTSTNTVVKDSVTLEIGSKNFKDAIGQITYPGVNTADYFSTLGIQVPDLDTTIAGNSIKRIVSDTLQFFLEIANEELSTYIEVSQPISGVVQDKPQYTNVSNGIGVFGSRLIISTKSKDVKESGRIMDNRTMEELLYSNLPESNLATKTKSFTRPGRCTVSADGKGNCQ